MPTMMSLARRLVICNFKGHQIAKNLQIMEKNKKLWLKHIYSSVKSTGIKRSKSQKLFTCDVNYFKL